MKTLIFSAAITLLLLSTNLSPANADKASRKAKKEMQKSASSFSTSMFVSGGKLNVLVFKYGIPTRTTISLRDKSGDFLYRESVDSHFDKFGRIMNLDNLEPGAYNVEVTSNGFTEKKQITVSEQITEKTLAVK